MPQDAFTLNVLCEELNRNLVGGKVNKIVQIDNDNVVLTIYANHKTQKLLLSVNPSMPRIGVVDKDYNLPLVAPNFCMLLRKHLLVSSIESVSLIGFDRIVEIVFLPSNELFSQERKTLYVELMGRYSNIILVENGIILGANRGINFFDNGVRPLFVGKKYTLPPVGDKKHPSDPSVVEYFSQEFTDLSNHIAKGVQGLAQSTASEIAKKFLENYSLSDSDFSNKMFNFLNDYLYNCSKKPCVVVKEDKVVDVLVKPYETIEGSLLFFESLLEAEEYYFNKITTEKEFNSKKERLLNILKSNIKRQNKKLNTLNARCKEALSCEDNKIKGELILANIHNIKNGVNSCEVLNYYDNTTTLIQLDENLSASKNAERYFKKYSKQKKTLSVLQPQIDGIKEELDYLSSIIDEIEIATDVLWLDGVTLEMQNAGIIKKDKVKIDNKKASEFIRYEYNGYAIKVGKNNVENDKLVSISKSNDVWIHVKDYHSSHVIISCNNEDFPLEHVLKIACEICAYYSKARNGGKVDVVYTKLKFIKKISKGKPGLVTYKNFKSLTVSPNKNNDFLKVL